ncbi:exopolysaccharide biosynthesis protein [Xanthomonas vasicola]|uniref:exopolysaccharide biosynthesis protein n=1 Tax=Xanthomonas vasicola TaxID=56459 RepID=UPI00034B8BCF|nr:exopolysaccharide biosynthesis protein [Xanthomonas vasicola]KEZ95694.1 membrane protein [Xanthomonas vasicola pv. vasculorum NCPPB 895]KFA38267.1 membrane protein [Xanthomonas vasicola pv. vasculorum NCPPB 206]MBV7304819.1 exopolysaccharide biosynthesis protein [Xanthomonas vasicola pv. vasculorum]MDO6933813.1 exopolysaccharide biosynthesis protein [Xanthomonas vasicola]MDO6937437.1 exopolysaccharide biosynthesis protein [Xanthomonas vasicola]
MTSSDDGSAPRDDTSEQMRYRNEGIRSLLAAFSEGDPDQVLRVREILADLQQSAFGVFLFLAILPSFIPIPGVAGGISGPLTVLIGLQMMCCLRKPWVPCFIGERGPRRRTSQRFVSKLGPTLQRLDRLLKPRLHGMLDRMPAQVFTGVLLVLVGILLTLPIPLTNYLFGLILLLFALALLERDGALMLVGWAAALISVAVFGVTSDQLVDLIRDWWPDAWR